MSDATKIVASFGLISLIGYVIFHGHRLGKDCLLCNYRGVTFIGASLAFGGIMAISG